MTTLYCSKCSSSFKYAGQDFFSFSMSSHSACFVSCFWSVWWYHYSRTVWSAHAFAFQGIPQSKSHKSDAQGRVLASEYLRHDYLAVWGRRETPVDVRPTSYASHQLSGFTTFSSIPGCVTLLLCSGIKYRCSVLQSPSQFLMGRFYCQEVRWLSLSNRSHQGYPYWLNISVLLDLLWGFM